MVKRYLYESRTDKTGKGYAVKIKVSTGKVIEKVSSVSKVKIFKKRAQQSEYREKKAALIVKLKEKGSNYPEYQREIKIATRKYQKAYKESGKIARKGTIEKRAHREVIKTKIGVRTRYRYGWNYWKSPMRNGVFDPTVGNCETPGFETDASARDGDHFTAFVEFCNDRYEKMLEFNTCPKTEVEGGACVVLFHKSSGESIAVFELGTGCKRW